MFEKKYGKQLQLVLYFLLIISLISYKYTFIKKNREKEGRKEGKTEGRRFPQKKKITAFLGVTCQVDPSAEINPLSKQ